MVHFIFSPKLVSCTFLIAYSKAKLNSSGDKASPCFNPYSIGKLEDREFPILTLLRVPSKHVLINLTNIFGTPNLILFILSHRHFRNLLIADIRGFKATALNQEIDNRWEVLYNKLLLKIYDLNINV